MTVLQELIFFKNTSTLEEPMYSGPSGKISIRQAIIVGGGCLPVLMYVLSTLDFMALPLALIPLALGLPSPKILSMDRLVASVIMFLISGSPVTEISKNKKSKKKKSTKSDSKTLDQKKLPSHFLGAKKIGSGKKEEKSKDKPPVFRTIPVGDFERHVNLKLEISRIDGTPFANHFVSIYLDGQRVGAMTTDATGQIIATIIPKNKGARNLKVVAEGIAEPVIDEIIQFSRE